MTTFLRRIRAVSTLLLLAFLVTACGRRQRDAAQDPEPTPAIPGPKPTVPRPAPKPAPAVPPAPAPAPREKPQPVVFRKPAAVPELDGASPYTANLKDPPVRAVEHTAGRPLFPGETRFWTESIHPLPDGRLLLAGPGALALWDGARVELVEKPAAGDRVEWVAVSRDGRRAAVAGRTEQAGDYVAAVDLQGRKRLWRTFSRVKAGTEMVTLSLDGSRVYHAPAYPTPPPAVVVLDTETGQILDVARENRGNRTGVAFPDNARVLMIGVGSGLTSSGLVLWESEKAPTTPLFRFDHRKGSWVHRAVAVSPSGKLVAWFEDRRFVVLSSETGEVRHHVGLAATPTEPSFSPDDRFLAWRDGLVRDRGTVAHLFDLKTGREALLVTTSDVSLTVGGLAFTRDGKTLLVGVNDQIYQFDVPRGE